MISRLWAALAAFLFVATAAFAQQVSPPNPSTAIACAYNSTTPTLNPGFFGYVQCNNLGQLMLGGGSISAVLTSQGPGNTPGGAAGGSQLVGAVYNSTYPTFTNGQQGAINVDQNGVLYTTPKRGTFAAPGCTVGVTSAQCLAAGTYNHVTIQNTSAVIVACSWGGTAAAASATSVQLAANASFTWGPQTSGVPTVALNCIAASAATPLYLEYN